jgi:hypothetical protein
MSNLRLINETSISSSVSSFSVEDVFSSDFDIYKITCTGLSTTGTTYVDVNMRLINASGSVITASNYKYGYRLGLSFLGFADIKSTSNNVIYRGFSETTDQSPEVASTVIWVFNPYTSTEHTQLLIQNTQSYGGSYYTFMNGGAWLVSNESIGGFQAVESNGSRPLASGTFRTYGLRVDK